MNCKVPPEKLKLVAAASILNKDTPSATLVEVVPVFPSITILPPVSEKLLPVFCSSLPRISSLPELMERLPSTITLLLPDPAAPTSMVVPAPEMAIAAVLNIRREDIVAELLTVMV